MKLVKCLGSGLIGIGFVTAMAVGAYAGDNSKCPHDKSAGKYKSGSMYSSSADFRPELQRASKLHGMQVTSFRGEDLGTLEHLAVDTSRDQVVYGIISSGGILDIGDHDTAIPFQLLKGCADSNRLIAMVDKDTFKSARNMTDKRITNLSDRNWAEKVANHYDVKPYWQTSRREASQCPWPGSQREQSREMRQEQRDQMNQRQNRQAMMRDRDFGKTGEVIVHDEIIGSTVKSQQDKELGELTDLVVDVQNGQIGYAVVSYGGTLGIGEKLTAVPMEQLSFQPQGPDSHPNVLAQFSEQQLKDAPTFKEDNWPNMTTQAWNQQVNDYYGSEPYYIIYGFVIESEDQAADQSNQVSLRGSIESINRDAMVSGQKCVQLRLKVSQDMTSSMAQQHEQSAQQQTAQRQQHQKLDGQTVTVNLAPESYLNEHNLKLSQGDQVTIHGYRSGSQSGQTTINAKSIQQGSNSATLRSQSGQPKWDTSRQNQ